MNNRIDQLFRHKNTGVFSVYFTAGYPALEHTVPLIVELENHGADMIEIGIPFSDPMADGPVIQESCQQALNNGMSVSKLFEQLEGIRHKVKIPLLLMGYFNPVMQYGFEAFCKKAFETGIDGIIIPDLPPDEYIRHYLPVVEKYGLRFIMLVAPQTTNERIRYIASNTKGFIYVVSSSSTTGIKSGFSVEQEAYFKRIAGMELKLPLMIGFGISDAKTFRQACCYASGAIVGSAFVKALSASGSDIRPVVQRFCSSILGI